MKDIKVSDTHNYAVIGHAHDGKTSLGEAILHAAGATQHARQRRRGHGGAEYPSRREENARRR